MRTAVRVTPGVRPASRGCPPCAGNPLQSTVPNPSVTARAIGGTSDPRGIRGVPTFLPKKNNAGIDPKQTKPMVTPSASSHRDVVVSANREPQNALAKPPQSQQLQHAAATRSETPQPPQLSHATGARAIWLRNALPVKTSHLVTTAIESTLLYKLASLSPDLAATIRGRRSNAPKAERGTSMKTLASLHACKEESLGAQRSPPALEPKHAAHGADRRLLSD